VTVRSPAQIEVEEMRTEHLAMPLYQRESIECTPNESENKDDKAAKTETQIFRNFLGFTGRGEDSRYN
jgi:hypothetical protein